MLTKPLAYKGPPDHLLQFFPLPLLYQGIGLLLDEMLLDWQHFREEQCVNGVFLFGEKLIKARLSWPFDRAPENNHCDCLIENEINTQSEERQISCPHLAALAIESKVRIDRLPYSVKQLESFESEWEYLFNWLAKQSFDPFPNMARHRVIYILDKQEDQFTVSLHKAYLTQKNEYQKKAILRINTNIREKLPKFVSLNDQQVLDEIQQLLTINSSLKLADNLFLLEHTTSNNLLEKIVLTGRCFWRTCHRQPLTWKRTLKASEACLSMDEGVFIDPVNSRIVNTSNNDIDINKLDKILHLLTNDSVKIKPQLSITTEYIKLSWQKKQLLELDVANITFNVGEQYFKLAELLYWIEIKQELVSQDWCIQIAQFLHQLDWIASVRASFELPVSQNFDISSRYLGEEISHWFLLLRGLQLENWQINFQPSFRLNKKKAKHWYHKISLITESENTINNQKSLANNQWFDLEIGVKVDGESVNIMPYIVKSLKEGLWNFKSTNSSKLPTELSIVLDDGTVVEINAERIANIVSMLVELYDSKSLHENQKLRLPVNQFSRLSNLPQEKGDSIDWQEAIWLKEKAESLSVGKGICKVKIPQNINAVLRDYQYDGLNWLQFLIRENLSGILADDMGLGKTVQTLVHIQCEKNAGRLDGPCMVVAPTSLLGNWISEATKFTPELKVTYWAGRKRCISQTPLSDSDLVVTSYGILLRDAELLNQQNIYLLILDEAQAIKNASSKVTRIAFSMNSKHRLCVTGTPLENHLGELWSLFHFLMPGFLGDQNQFKKLFQIPIEKEQDQLRQQALSTRIAPFILRRTKDRVAADLPAKTVMEEFLELQEEQADIYETIRLSMVDEVQKAMNSSASSGNQLLIGNALLRLRQVCCHPRLVKSIYKTITQKELSGKIQEVTERSYFQGDLFSEIQQPTAEPKEQDTLLLTDNTNEFANSNSSSKLDWLYTRLPEMISAGRKVLIFSSFTSMLDIIAELLSKMSIDYLMLTGSSRNRTELVSRFQNGDIPIFLISLKAGGAGLNLTQADTVIHFDPWWNPAAENQASDRAHRIGQDKPVFVYKLITKGSVEERINKMQSHKSELANKLYDKQTSSSDMEVLDWKKLLAPLDENEM